MLNVMSDRLPHLLQGIHESVYSPEQLKSTAGVVRGVLQDARGVRHPWRRRRADDEASLREPRATGARSDGAAETVSKGTGRPRGRLRPARPGLRSPRSRLRPPRRQEVQAARSAVRAGGARRASRRLTSWRPRRKPTAPARGTQRTRSLR
jgi:hypothetical protein